jgi:selenoprotein W-related protein
LAAEIRQQYPGVEVKLVPSKGGRFEVVKDGVPIYEKSKTGRHARPGEVLNLLEASAKRERGSGH